VRLVAGAMTSWHGSRALQGFARLENFRLDAMRG